MIVKCNECEIEDDSDRMAFSKYDWQLDKNIAMCPKCFAKNNPDEVKETTRCIFCNDVMWIRKYPDHIDDVCMRCRRNRGRLSRTAKASSNDV